MPQFGVESNSQIHSKLGSSNYDTIATRYTYMK